MTSGNEALHLPTVLKTVIRLSRVTQKYIGAELGYSEAHFSRVVKQKEDDVIFALDYMRAMGRVEGRLEERKRAGVNKA